MRQTEETGRPWCQHRLRKAAGLQSRLLNPSGTMPHQTDNSATVQDKCCTLSPAVRAEKDVGCRPGRPGRVQAGGAVLPGAAGQGEGVQVLHGAAQHHGSQQFLTHSEELKEGSLKV